MLFIFSVVGHHLCCVDPCVALICNKSLYFDVFRQRPRSLQSWAQCWSESIFYSLPCVYTFGTVSNYPKHASEASWEVQKAKLWDILQLKVFIRVRVRFLFLKMHLGAKCWYLFMHPWCPHVYFQCRIKVEAERKLYKSFVLRHGEGTRLRRRETQSLFALVLAFNTGLTTDTPLCSESPESFLRPSSPSPPPFLPPPAAFVLPIRLSPIKA